MTFCYQALKVKKTPSSQKLQVCLSINRLFLRTDIEGLNLHDLIQQKFYMQFNVYFNVL